MATRRLLRWRARGWPQRLFPQIVSLVAVAVVGVVVFRHDASLEAQRAQPTFAVDVAPILFRNCTTCHRPGGLGPFSLMDYDGARSNADDIRDAIATNYMPPW